MQKIPRTKVLQLVQKAKQGDEPSFNDLIFLYRDKILAQCTYLTRNSADADDLYQEVVLKIFRKLSQFRGDSSFYTWLYRIIRNEFLMKVRGNSVLNSSVPLDVKDDAHLDKSWLSRRDGAQVSTPERLDLVRAIAKLPPSQRAAFISHDIYGFKHSEDSSISLGTSKSNLHRARVHLQRLLKPKFRPLSQHPQV
jgi:RNA polymerase sigma-70 factor (ECF subfamily)